MTLRERYKQVIDWFSANMPEARSELDFRNPYELLVAVILSAQCTDKRVNTITPAFLKPSRTRKHCPKAVSKRFLNTFDLLLSQQQGQTSGRHGSSFMPGIQRTSAFDYGRIADLAGRRPQNSQRGIGLCFQQGSYACRHPCI